MAITENIDDFFADFGVNATFGSDTHKVLFDKPESIVAEGLVVTAEYEIKYKAGNFPTLAHGSTISVDGTNYTVNTITAIEDGKIKAATLSST